MTSKHLTLDIVYYAKNLTIYPIVRVLSLPVQTKDQLFAAIKIYALSVWARVTGR